MFLLVFVGVCGLHGGGMGWDGIGRDGMGWDRMGGAEEVPKLCSKLYPVDGVARDWFSWRGGGLVDHQL